MREGFGPINDPATRAHRPAGRTFTYIPARVREDAMPFRAGSFIGPKHKRHNWRMA
jgi:hypothetical protein